MVLNNDVIIDNIVLWSIGIRIQLDILKKAYQKSLFFKKQIPILYNCYIFEFKKNNKQIVIKFITVKKKYNED